MEHSFTSKQKEEIKGIVHEALMEFFSTKGATVKNVIVATATILGALGVIAMAGKWILGILGFTYIMK